MNLEPYPAYRGSDIEWMGKIPRHWRAGKTKHFAELRSGHTPSRSRPEYWVDCNIPWFSLADVWQIRDGKKVYLSETKENISTLGLANSAADLLPAGAVIVSRTASVGFSGITKIPMATTQDFVNWLPGSTLISKFLLFVFRAMEREFERLKMGSTHKTIYMPDVLSFSTPVPPVEEQTQIAKFLDYETAKIDALIEKQQQLIALLQEKRQAVISYAVTKGLYPDAPMRDSGVEWLGEVPAHWRAAKLKHHARQIVDGAHFTPTYVDEGVPFLRVTDVQTFPIDRAAIKYIPKVEHEELVKRCRPEPGDLLLSKNGTIGVPRVVDWDWDFSIFVSLCLIKLKATLDVRFLSYFCLTHQIREQIFGLIKQSTVINLHLDKIENFWLAVPPLGEQQAIVEYLGVTAAEYDMQIEHAEEMNQLLQERRTALISAAVTGKIDVRGWKPPKAAAEAPGAPP